jgi:ferritin-like metal-binding protein YciE
MGLFSKDIKTFEDLYKHGLQDIYYAENQIVKSLPTMIDNASDPELKRGLQQHLRETQEQVKRLEQVFKLHDETPSGTKCPAIDGIIDEGSDLIGEVEDKAVLNVGLIAAAQAVEHYEITRYGALIAWAGAGPRQGCGHPCPQSQRRAGGGQEAYRAGGAAGQSQARNRERHPSPPAQSRGVAPRGRKPPQAGAEEAEEEVGPPFLSREP